MPEPYFSDDDPWRPEDDEPHVVKVWEVESICEHDENMHSDGLYSTLEKAKASVKDAPWEPYLQSWHVLWANVDSGYEDDGEYFSDSTFYYITERKVL